MSSEREQATQNLNEAHPSITSLTNANQNCVLGTDVAEKYRTHVTSGVRVIAEGYSYIIRTLANINRSEAGRDSAPLNINDRQKNEHRRQRK